VQREAKLGRRVLCLSAIHPSLDSYLCNRFVLSLQAKYDGPSSVWLGVSLDHLPVSDVVSQVKGATGKPWRIVVIDQIEQIDNPKVWWAPIVKLPGLEFVPVSG